MYGTYDCTVPLTAFFMISFLVRFIFRYNSTEEHIQEVNDDGIEIYHINFVQSSEDINLSYIRENSGDKYNSHFIILIENETFPGAWLNQLFERFWSFNLLKVLVIFWHNKINIFTYTPFGAEFLIELPSNETKYDKLFWDKTENLNGHPFRVTMFYEKTRAIRNSNGKFSGTDGYFTDVMVDKLNATLEWLPPTDGYDYGEMLANGTPTGSLGQIIARTADVAFNTRFLRLGQFRGKVQITFPNGRDDLCILVAKSGFASNVNNIFRSFTLIVWIFVFVSLLSTSLVFIGIYRVETNNPSMKNILFNFYSWNLAQPITKLPERWATKLIIGFWIIYCLLITSSYQGNLFSNLVRRPILPDINTMRQLEESTYEILAFGRYAGLLQNILNQTGSYNKLVSRIRSVSPEELVQYTEQNDVRYAYANKYHINEYISNSDSHTINGVPIYNNMKECPIPFLVAYTVGYGSPYLYRINTILRRTQEAGLIFYWDEKSVNFKSGSQRDNGGPHPLGLEHVQSSFYILFVGLSISIFAFLLELLLIQVKTSLCYSKAFKKQLTGKYMLNQRVRWLNVLNKKKVNVE